MIETLLARCTRACIGRRHGGWLRRGPEFSQAAGTQGCRLHDRAPAGRHVRRRRAGRRCAALCAWTRGALPLVGSVRLSGNQLAGRAGVSRQTRPSRPRRPRCGRRRRWSMRSRDTSSPASLRTTTSSGRSCPVTPRPPRRRACRATVRASPPVDRPSRLTYNFHTAELTVGFTPDVFGANRRKVESLDAQAQLQRFELEATYISLASNVVAAAIQEASTRAQLKATREIIADNEKSLAILRDKFNSGLCHADRPGDSGAAARTGAGAAAAAGEAIRAESRLDPRPCRESAQSGRGGNIRARFAEAAGRTAAEPAVENHRAAAGHPRRRRAAALRQCAGRGRGRRHGPAVHHHRRRGRHRHAVLADVQLRRAVLEPDRRRDAAVVRRRHTVAHQARRRRGAQAGGARSIRARCSRPTRTSPIRCTPW